MNTDAVMLAATTPGPHGRTIDLVRIDRGRFEIVDQALERAGAAVAVHDLPSAFARAPVMPGIVTLVCVATFSMASLLLLADLRSGSESCLIVMTSGITAEQRILARMHGADHVLDTDMDERELAALLQNEFRRRAEPIAVPRAAESEHRWSLDPQGWLLAAPNGRTARLSKSEYGVMSLLLDGAGRVQPRALLRAAIQGDVERGRVLDVLISRIRRKVWDCAQMELPVRSARAEGYVFAGVSQLRDA